MYFYTQKFLILGASKSGCAVADYLLEKGVNCYVYEELKSDKIEKTLRDLSAKGAMITTPDRVESVLSIVDILVLSPGVPINHRVAVRAKALGKTQR